MSKKKKRYPLSVLVVDDNAIDQKILAAIVKELGHLVSVVDNGLEVLHMLKNIQFDVVFMGVNISGLDGIECTYVIRNCGELYCDICIIATTPYELTDENKVFFLAGMNGSISKPFSMNVIKTILDNLKK